MLGGAIAPFIGSNEIQHHFLAGEAATAVDLVRLQWGYMMNRFSNSTTIEGYWKTGKLHYEFYGDVDT
jgi:hypothetical protein